MECYATGKPQHPKPFFFFRHKCKEVHIWTAVGLQSTAIGLQSTAIRTQSTKIMDWTDYFCAVRPNGRTGLCRTLVERSAYLEPLAALSTEEVEIAHCYCSGCSLEEGLFVQLRLPEYYVY